MKNKEKNNEIDEQKEEEIKEEIEDKKEEENKEIEDKNNEIKEDEKKDKKEDIIEEKKDKIEIKKEETENKKEEENEEEVKDKKEEKKEDKIEEQKEEYEDKKEEKKEEKEIEKKFDFEDKEKENEEENKKDNIKDNEQYPQIVRKEKRKKSSSDLKNKQIIENFLRDDKKKLRPIREVNEEEIKSKNKSPKKENKETKENNKESKNLSSKGTKEDSSTHGSNNNEKNRSIRENTKGKEIKEEEKENEKKKEENENFGKEHEKQIKNIKKRIDKIISSAKLPQFKVEDFIIKGQLGEGSYGAIYKVIDKNNNKYAMKKIIAHDIDEVEDFITEFELVSTCKHPNIMKIYSMCVRILDPTTYAVYILMELANYDWDHEIKQHLQQRKNYKEEELISIMKQLVSASIYMQKEMNIVHRNIKPQNILKFNNGLYNIANFGEDKEIKISKQVNTLRGTELYMSPLLYDGLKKDKDDVTHNPYKSDVFSLGFCFMYSSSLNFNIIYEVRDLNDMSKLDKILHKHLKNKYTENFIKVVELMLEVDESERIDFLDLESIIKEYFPDEQEQV